MVLGPSVGGLIVAPVLNTEVGEGLFCWENRTGHKFGVFVGKKTDVRGVHHHTHTLDTKHTHQAGWEGTLTYDWVVA